MRKITYSIETEYLSPYASFSIDATRDTPIKECEIRTEYQRDRDRILHSKSFRRLKHKTQVFLSPEGDHYRTRLTHTLEVSQIARSISRALRLNEDLTEAIALGHDLGHTPFGHAGERTLRSITGHFNHNEQSLRVVEVLEEGGAGLNLTTLVKDGILNHKKGLVPLSLEGMVVNLSDRIAYINHDIDDGIRAGLICEDDLPIASTQILGRSKGERINNMIYDIVRYSDGKDYVKQSPEFDKATNLLREYMFSSLYNQTNKAKADEVKVTDLLTHMFETYRANPTNLPDFYQSLMERYPIDVVISDYIAGMTDTYAIAEYKKLYIPSVWKL